MAAIERALAARHACREGGELRFLCPAHDDRHPSARWHPGKRTWFCDACKAGGGWRDLAARLGLDLPAAGERLAKIDAVYDYRAAEGPSLDGIAGEVRLLDLSGKPEKGDVSEWIAARESEGKTGNDLRREIEQLAASAPRSTPPAPVKVSRRPSRVRCAADIEPQAVSFLWRPYIPFGKLTLLEGDPGQGKSWIAAALATAGSHGKGLPGVAPFAPFRSVIFTAEDGLADTLRPRLDLLAADLRSIHLHEEPLDLAQADDFAELEQAVLDLRARLVILDPILAYFGARTDAYRANEVRAILAPLARLADRHGCAVLAIRHLNKTRGSRSIYAGQGSIDFAAAARSVLLAGCGGDDAADRAFVHIKSNLAALGSTLAYTVDVQGFRWTGESVLRASDLLAPEATGDELSSLDEARAFLRSLLAGGPLTTEEIWTAARQAGLSERTLRRAKQREGIVARRQGYGSGGTWRWSLGPAPGETEEES